MGVTSVALGFGLYAYTTRLFNDKVSPGSVALPAAPRDEGAELAPAETVSVDRVAYAVGTVRSKASAEISSKIAARVKAVHVSAGQSIKKGDLLVELDQRDLAAQASAAGAALQATRAELRLADKEHQRSAELLAKQVISQQQYDLSESRREVAQAGVTQARQQLSSSASTLDYARIVAPADGIVIERHVEPGDLATPGRPLLSLYDPSALRLEAAVRESLVAGLKVDQKLEVSIPAADRVLEGRVEEIVPRATSTTRSFVVKVGLPASTKLYPGMFGRVAIPTGESELVLVPGRAVRQVGQIALVDIAHQDGRFERRQVRTGRVLGDRVEILSGIEPAADGRGPERVRLH